MRETPNSLNYYSYYESNGSTLDNDHGYSKNVKDWTIRRRVPNAAMIGNGTVSETAKVSVVNEGLINLRRFEVQSSPIGNYRGC